MTDRRKRRRDIAKVRIIGPPGAVDQVLDAITNTLPATAPARPHATRHQSPSRIRVYVEVTPR